MRKLPRAAIVLASFAAACGGPPAVPASCGHVGVCGGNIVGDWAVAGSCVAPAAFAAFYAAVFHTSCAPDVTVSDDVTRSYVPRTVSFADDGTYAGTFALTGSIAIRIPNTCLGRTCADLDAQVRAMVAPGGDVTAASCSETVTACSCSMTRSLESRQIGSYTAAGFSLVTRPDTGPSTHVDYCVAEPELHLVARVPMSAALDAPLIFASDVVLVRR